MFCLFVLNNSIRVAEVKMESELSRPSDEVILMRELLKTRLG